MNSKILSVLVLILVALGGWLVFSDETPTSSDYQVLEADTDGRREQLEVNFQRLISLVDESRELRMDATSLFAAVDRKLRSEEHLNAAEQRAIKLDFVQYRENRESLGEIAGSLQAYTDEGLAITFPATTPSKVVKREGILGFGDATELLINPNDDLGRLMTLEIKMWLAAKLIIIDNYAVSLLRYWEKGGSRRQFDLDSIDPEARAFLEEVAAEILDGDKYDRIARSIALVQQIIDLEKNMPPVVRPGDKDGLYLNALIERSYAYRRIPELGALDRAGFNIDALQNAFLDDIVRLGDKATYELSESFGNSVGASDDKRFKLSYLSPERQSMIQDELELLDILFEKTAGRLTDMFIPGHFGHVAIWVGDKSDIPELKRLGVWQELPGIEARVRASYGYDGPGFQRAIEQGNGILQAMRTGVELNTFTNFLNVDDLAVIRDHELTDDQKKRYLLNAFAQLGKEYDFNFDVETSKRIVCSELAFVVYDDYDWLVEMTVGRYTVSPDNVATLALEEHDPFTPIVLFHDGRESPEESRRFNLSKLLEGAYDEVIFQ